MESCSMFLCKLCGKYFSTSLNLSRHLVNGHKKDVQSSRYSCKLCDKDFSTCSNLFRHLESIHKKEAESRVKHICKKCGKIYATKSFLCTHEKHCIQKKSNNLKCPLCNKVEAELIDMYSHFLNKHGIKIESEKLHFESFLDFKKWKHEIEINTLSKYLLSTGSKQLSGQKTCSYYRCHKTGFTRPTDNFRRTKLLGSNKIDGYCPAKLQVVKEQGGNKITVNYVKTHIGHNMEIERIPFTKQNRANLSEKIHVSFDETVSSAKDIKSDSADQMHLSTKNNLNINQAFETNNGFNEDSKQTFGEVNSKQLQLQPPENSVKSHIQSLNDSVVINQCQIPNLVPFDKIISSAKDNKTDSVNRMQLLTKKDLYNIKQALKTKNGLNTISKQVTSKEYSKLLEVQPSKVSLKSHIQDLNDCNVINQCQIENSAPVGEIISSSKNKKIESVDKMHLLAKKDMYTTRQAIKTNNGLDTFSEVHSKQLQIQPSKDSVKTHIQDLHDSVINQCQIPNIAQFDEIISSAKDNKTDSVDQMHLLAKKDLHNIRQALKTNNGLNKDIKQTFSEKNCKRLKVQPSKDSVKSDVQLLNESNVINQCHVQKSAPSSAKENKTDNVDQMHLLAKQDLYTTRQAAMKTNNGLNKNSKRTFSEVNSKQLQVQPSKDSVKTHIQDLHDSNVINQCQIPNIVQFDEIISSAKDNKTDNVDQMHLLVKTDMYTTRQVVKTNNGLNKNSKHTFSEVNSKQLQVQPCKDSVKTLIQDLHDSNVINQCQVPNSVQFDEIISSRKDNETDSDHMHLLAKKNRDITRQVIKTNGEPNKDSKQTFSEENSKQIQVQPTKDSVQSHIQPLNDSDVINQYKIQNNIIFDEIISSAEDSKTENKTDNVDQMHLLAKKDLHNIRQALKNNNGLKKKSKLTFSKENSKQPQTQPAKDSVKPHIQHVNGSDVNNQSWVNKMQETNNDSPIRFFKNQGEINQKYPDLRINDFLLIIINKVQLDFLMNYGNHCLCIDTTHGQNRPNFKLTTLIVLNSEGQGLPCLFAVSNRTETIVYKIIFDVLKLCLNGNALTPKVLVTDMTGNFYLAWLNIMGPVKFRLYCTWHVDKAWRENLISKIENKESQEYAYKCLRTLLEEQDRVAFERMVKNFLMDLQTSAEFKGFLVDFRTSFFGCRQSWAACYRKQAEIDFAAMEKIHFEMHEELGTVNLKDKDVKQPDKVIDMLLRHVVIRSLNKEQQNHKQVDIIQRHNSMLSTHQNFTVINETADKWFVPCVKLNKIFTVQTATATCSCDVKCEACDACIHKYVCSCPDSSKNGNMCKHIHLVCRSLVKESVEVPGKNGSSTCIDDDNSSWSEELVARGEADRELPLSYLKNKLQNTFNRILRRVDGVESYDIVRNALIGAFDDINSIVK